MRIRRPVQVFGKPNGFPKQNFPASPRSRDDPPHVTLQQSSIVFARRQTSGPEMIHLMETANPDPLDGRPEHGGRDRHACFGACQPEPPPPLMRGFQRGVCKDAEGLLFGPDFAFLEARGWAALRVMAPNPTRPSKRALLHR